MNIQELQEELERMKTDGCSAEEILTFWDENRIDPGDPEESEVSPDEWDTFTAKVANAIRPDDADEWAVSATEMIIYGYGNPGMLAFYPASLPLIRSGRYGNIAEECALYELFRDGTDMEISWDDITEDSPAGQLYGVDVLEYLEMG